jgi:phosphatidylglycerol lysyltransferase
LRAFSTRTLGNYSGMAMTAAEPSSQSRRVSSERTMATEIVMQYARVPLDTFKLWPDKSHFFSSSGSCVIACRVANKVGIALGDPVGAEAEVESTAHQFLQWCRQNGWSVAFYQTLPDFVPLYRSFRLKKLKICDEALVELIDFSLEGQGKTRATFQDSLVRKDGHTHARVSKPPLPEEIVA